MITNMNADIIGNKIAELRKKRNITQQQLADEISVTDKAISKWETGGGLPDISNLIPLASALGSSVDEIISGSPLGSEDNQDESDGNQEIKQHIKIPRPFVIGAAGITLLSLLVAVVSLFLLLNTSPTYVVFENTPNQDTLHNQQPTTVAETLVGINPDVDILGDVDILESVSILHNGRIVPDFTIHIEDSILLSVARTSASGAHTRLSGNEEITWFSSDTSVFTVTPVNAAETMIRIDMVGPGRAYLRVLVDGIQAESIVRGIDAPGYRDHAPVADMIFALPLDPTSVAIMYNGIKISDITVPIGYSHTLSVMAASASGITIPLTGDEEIEWFSSDTDKFTVTPANTSGNEVIVHTRNPGTAYLIVYVDGIRAECIVRVRN